MRHLTSQSLCDVAANRQGPVRAVLVLVCFFFSGLAGLIYQTLWVRMIDKVIGSAPFAVAAVVATFMGGLALGSWVVGRRVDGVCRRDDLLALYGKIEIGIGLYALGLPWLIGALKPFYRMAYAHLWPLPWLYTLFTFGGCLLLLIVPTALMGATLPVLCRYYVRELPSLGTHAGRLYGLNTIGAAVGSVLCGFWLIPHLGLPGAQTATIALNVMVGASCIWLARRSSATEAPALPQPAAASPPHPTRLPARNGLRLWALVVFGVSGFSAMACEVLWTRLIGLIVGPTVYAFSVVVATFIIGLAAGGMLFGWLADRLDRDLGLLHATQLGAALLSVLVSQVLGDSQFFFAKLIHTHQHHYPSLMAWQSLVLFAIMLGPTLCWGAAFPLVNRIHTRHLSTLGRSIGNAYAVNTIGAIAGAFAAGYILIPLAGQEMGLRLVVGLQGVTAGLGWMAFAGRYSDRPWRSRWAAAAAALAAMLAVAGHYPTWPPGLLSRGWYRDFGALQDELGRTGWWQALRQGKTLLARERSGQQVVFQGEGVGGFTTVETETTSLGTVEWAMFNSGKADASSHGDRSTQTLSGHIPLLFHPGARQVMILGLASGMTSGEVLGYPIERLDILEINEQVVEACRRFFTPFNNDCLSDPRTRLILQDGRNHLALTDARYDVIISEPSNPWMAGLANLYTLEFFQLARQRLTAQGIFAQWIQAYEMDWDTFCLLGRTFSKAFGGGALFKVGPGDYLLLGFADQNGLNWQTAGHNLVHAQRSQRMTLKSVESLARLVVTEDLPLLFGPGPLHTDQRPRLEYAAPRRLYSAGVDLETAAAQRRRLGSATEVLLRSHSGVEDTLNLIEFGASLYLPLFNELNPADLTPDQNQRYMGIVDSYCDATLVPAYGIFDDTGAKTLCAQRQIARMQGHLASGKGRPADYYNLGLALSAAGRMTEAARAFEKVIARDAGHVEALMALGLLYAQAGRFPEAIDHLRRVTTLAPARPNVFKNLGMAEAAAGDLEAADRHLRQALRLAPGDVHALNELGLVQLKQRRPDQARATLSAALDADADNAETHYNLGLFYYTNGEPDQAVKHFEQAVRLRPDNENARHNLRAALALRARRQGSEAVAQ